MSKIDDLFEALQAGWCSAQSLAAANGWANHTLRGAISMNARKRGLVVDRKRENGVTFYRIAIPAVTPAPDPLEIPEILRRT